MKKRHVSLKDIAEDLGLSIMAVSKALRGHADIGDETRRRVLARATELQYRPNALPSQMRSGRTRIIGLVVPSLELTYFAKLAHGLTLHLREHNYQLLLCNSEGSPEDERGQVDSLLAYRADAIVVCPAGPLRERGELAYLLDSGVPYVLAGRGMPSFPANFVGSDGNDIGRVVTEHLLERGCRRIAHIRGPDIAGARQRLEGYRQALKAADLPSPTGLIKGGADGIEAGYAAMRELLSEPLRPDGVFCYTDLAAGGALRAAAEAGLHVPHDVAIAGVGNLVFTDLLRTPLTTIDQNPVEMGAEVAALILEILNGTPLEQPATRLVPFRLIERESSARPLSAMRQT